MEERVLSSTPKPNYVRQKGQSETESHKIPSRFPMHSPINPEFLTLTHRTRALSRLQLTVYTMSGFAAAQPEMEQKNEGCQHM